MCKTTLARIHHVSFLNMLTHDYFMKYFHANFSTNPEMCITTCIYFFLYILKLCLPQIKYKNTNSKISSKDSVHSKYWTKRYWYGSRVILHTAFFSNQRKRNEVKLVFYCPGILIPLAYSKITLYFSILFK